MPYLDAGSVRLFMTDEGPRDRPAVVLVHGWACDSQDWCGQLAAFSDDFRVIAPDLRGHGRSEVTKRGYHPEAFATDLWRLLDTLEVGYPILIGHSLGGVIVSVMAARRPRAVRAVIAVDPALGLDDDFAVTVPARLATYSSPGGLEAVAHNFATRWSGPRTPAWLPAFHARRVLGMPQHVVASTFGGLYLGPGRYGLRPDSDQLLADRGCPTLSIYADATRAELELAMVTSPSEVHVWSDVGHFAHQEQPARFNTLARQWLASLPPSGSRHR